MEIIIHQAILHVLDTTLDAPVLSGGGMGPTAEKMAYLQYHIEKLEYKVKYKIVTGEIMDKLNGKFPKTLPLSEQGKFIIGYYQQTQDFYKKKEGKEI